MIWIGPVLIFLVPWQILPLFWGDKNFPRRELNPGLLGESQISNLNINVTLVQWLERLRTFHVFYVS